MYTGSKYSFRVRQSAAASWCRTCLNELMFSLTIAILVIRYGTLAAFKSALKSGRAQPVRLVRFSQEFSGQSCFQLTSVELRLISSSPHDQRYEETAVSPNG